MAMSLSTLTTSAWDIMHDFLFEGTYKISTNNVISNYNDKLVEQIGLPIVVIKPVTATITNVDLKGTLKRAKIGYQIDVYVEKSDELKVLVDQIIDKLITGYVVFVQNKLRKPKEDDWFTSIDANTWQEGRYKIHMYSIGVNYKYTA